jgi:hypothetical protein
MVTTVAIDLLSETTGSSRKTIAWMLNDLVKAMADDINSDEINEAIKELAGKFDDETLVYQIQRNR